ncbi:MAG: cysteine methyltransferase [Magnetovibrio sp.]|nr:cysteine methyltransferase [Magnetovibrio sp.]|tara:strand:+ start:539 stop:1009 length:471 start_codon:yes stop_codon:yes gene_type:complete
MNVCITWFSLPSPVGVLTVYAINNALSALEWGRAPKCKKKPAKVLSGAYEQLEAYFTHKRRHFDLNLAPAGTQFQISVWKAIDKVPYGETRTYGYIAKKLKSSARAVGTACAYNPLPIIIPCHRILGSGGQMTGYSGGAGVETKAQLLHLEGVNLV